MSLAIAAVVMLAQDAGSKSAKPTISLTFCRIITRTKAWTSRVFRQFGAGSQADWYAKLPSEAKQNIKGRVVVGFGIKDGAAEQCAKVEVSSGNSS